MLPDGRRLGAHLPVLPGLVKAVERAHEIGASTLQVFGDNPTAWKRRAGPPADAAAFRERLRELDIGPVAVHAAYLVNLAGSDEDFFDRSVELLVHDLEAAQAFDARYVNVHTGSHRGAGLEAGIERLAEGVAVVLARVPEGPKAARLVLENSAGGGFPVGVTVEELAAAADAIDGRGVARDRVGFCIDTAHAWAAGYRLSEPDEVDALVERFDALLGLDRLAMMHLNDSKSECGARLDRHEHIGAGRIGERGMTRLLTHPALRDVPTYLETPGMDEGYDAINVRRALDLALGRPLDPLPPGAMDVRGSRSRGAPAPVRTSASTPEPEPV